MNYVKSFTRYLVENGLLFEINRKVLHPLGLSMVVDVDFKNKKQIAITGIAETEDEEGFLFDSETFIYGQERFNKFLKKSGQDRLNKRKELLGFIEQEKDDV